MQSHLAHPWPRPGILEISPYVGGKSEIEGQASIVKLSSNESALGPSPKAMDALRSTAHNLHRYPEGGADSLRAAIGRRFNLDPETLCCGAGSDELISLLVKSYAGPGDEVLYSAHGFLMYRLSALAAGAHPVAATEHSMRTSVDNMLSRVTSRTRLVFVANPNNPTGSYLTSPELRRLHAGLPPDVLMIIDAAYTEYVDVEDYSSGEELVRDHRNVVMLRTFSKIFGLAALRLGWMYAHSDIIDVMNRVRGPFNVSVPAQIAGISALEDIEHQQRSKAHNDHWRKWVSGTLSALGFKVHPSVANFVLVEFPDADGKRATDANAFLEANGVIPRLVAGYGLPHCLRISIGLEHENRKLVEVMTRFAEQAPV